MYKIDEPVVGCKIWRTPDTELTVVQILGRDQILAESPDEVFYLFQRNPPSGRWHLAFRFGPVDLWHDGPEYETVLPGWYDGFSINRKGLHYAKVTLKGPDTEAFEQFCYDLGEAAAEILNKSES